MKLNSQSWRVTIVNCTSNLADQLFDIASDRNRPRRWAKLWKQLEEVSWN